MLNDIKLNEYAESCAQDILAETEDYDTAYDLAHEYADGSEYVIYYSKAHELCQNCVTDDGDNFFEEVGPGENPTYNSIACIIAYGELFARIHSKLNEHFNA
jgi:hypothetical protein